MSFHHSTGDDFYSHVSVCFYFRWSEWISKEITRGQLYIYIKKPHGESLEIILTVSYWHASWEPMDGSKGEKRSCKQYYDKKGLYQVNQTNLWTVTTLSCYQWSFLCLEILTDCGYEKLTQIFSGEKEIFSGVLQTTISKHHSIHLNTEINYQRLSKETKSTL